MRGVLYVAYGQNARHEVLQSAASLRQSNPGLAAAVISDHPVRNLRHIHAPDSDPGARSVKLRMDLLSPFEHTAYLDADTRVFQSLEAGFDMLADGWELVITPSRHQEDNVFYHIHPNEGQATIAHLGYVPLQLQGGVIFFRKTCAVHQFFEVWREEWARFQGQDQAALMRALHRVPVRVWILGRPFNGGAVVAHHFGQAARNRG